MLVSENSEAQTGTCSQHSKILDQNRQPKAGPAWVGEPVLRGEDSFVHIQLAITLSEQPSHPSPSSGLPCPELSCWLHHLDSDVLEGPRPPRARTPRAASSLPVQCVSQQSSSVVKLMHLG